MNTEKVKYPRTRHLPWSLGVLADDVILISTEVFYNREVIITEKLDGENTTIYSHGMHARSLETTYHPSRSWIKAFHARINHLIPSGWRICGENMYAQHTIKYENLKSYFYVFSVWNESNECLNWDETCDWAQLLGASTPEVLYRGIWNEDAVKKIKIDPQNCEGYVVRPVKGFHFDHFNKCVAKFVRKGHVDETGEHWMYKELIPNKLIENK
ncbi:MAG: 2'-5' RNA ligase [Chlamydiales bacterium 38-26]|nr:MAG: 2'-5' RNA ligase [Chlamydiales bacterium 38-26]